MSSIEGIKGSDLVYQGSVTNQNTRNGSAVKTDTTEQSSANTTAAQTQQLTLSQNNNDSTTTTNTTNTQQSNTDAIHKAIAEVNKQTPNSMVQFGIDDRTNRITIKVLDKDTKKVIREFPAEKTLDIVAKVMEMAGILVDEKR